MANTNEVSRVQTQVGQLIQQANPNLSKEAKDEIIQGVGEQASRAFQSMKSEAGNCRGVVAGVFKEAGAGKEYGGYIVTFDSKGDAIFENHSDGPTTAGFKPEDKNNVDNLKDRISLVSTLAPAIEKNSPHVAVSGCVPPPKFN